MNAPAQLSPRSPYARMAALLLSLPAKELSDKGSDVAIETAQTLTEANYVAGGIYIMALQERAKEAERTDLFNHWSGVLGAIKRVLATHAGGER